MGIVVITGLACWGLRARRQTRELDAKPQDRLHGPAQTKAPPLGGGAELGHVVIKWACRSLSGGQQTHHTNAAPHHRLMVAARTRTALNARPGADLAAGASETKRDPAQL